MKLIRLTIEMAYHDAAQADIRNIKDFIFDAASNLDAETVSIESEDKTVIYPDPDFDADSDEDDFETWQETARDELDKWRTNG